MKFMRKNGKVIPIREEAKTQAKIGAATGTLMRVARESLVAKNKKAQIAFLAAGATTNLVGDIRAMSHSYQTGKEKGFAKGVGNYLGLTLARYGGNLTAQYATGAALKAGAKGSKKLADQIRFGQSTGLKDVHPNFTRLTHKVNK